MQNVSPTVLLLTPVQLFHFCILFIYFFVFFFCTVSLLLFEPLNFSRKNQWILFTIKVRQCYKETGSGSLETDGMNV